MDTEFYLGAEIAKAFTARYYSNGNELIEACSLGG
jgi:hypothetical protein